MLLSLRKNGLTSLFKEVRVFKGCQASQSKGLTSGEVPELPGRFGELPGEVWETSWDSLDCC